ncbi:MAG: M13-type metalloendopeptidase [Verrucomicrobiota bacterium]
MTTAPFALTTALSILILAAATGATDDSPKAAAFGTWGFDLSGRNLSVRPGDDFFAYANGAYLDRTAIPADRVRFGNFDQLAILSETRVRGILEDAIKHPDEANAKIGAYYAAYMDEELVEKTGIQPIAANLARIQACATRDELIAIMAKPGSLCGGLFGAGISADAKNPARYAVYVGSGGLGLPDKGYYLKPSFAAIKTKYEAYVTTLLTLIQWPEPAARAREIVAFETRLAEASWERAELRDRDKTYNLMSPADLTAHAPGFDFAGLLGGRGLAKVDRLIVSDKSAFPKKAAIFAETPMETLKAWAACGLANASAPFLTKAFVEAGFEFNAKTLAGQPEPLARWKRAVMSTNEALGEAVGQVYVARYFPAESRRQMLDLVNNIKSVLATRINNLDWMGDATKEAAQEKLAKLTVKIGYPDEFRDYSALVVKPDDLYGNVTRAIQFDWQRELDRLDKPVDRKEWGMPPQKVNAYYNATLSEIVFPAAILQPPFFDPKADPAVNYGGIGGVIGHEISHGFDDQGRKSNGDGVLQDWWTAEDAEHFNRLAERLGAQYERIEVLPGEFINGKLTMGENIGDMGGLNLALDAYHASLDGKPAPVLDGVTGVQRVFLSWAQIWRQKIRDEAQRKQINTDPHSPALARVNGVVRNIDAWYEAFDIKPGDKLYVKPEDRVKIW